MVRLISGPMKNPVGGAFSRAELETLEQAFQQLASGFDLPPFESGSADTGPVLMEVASRLRDNYPYFHPLYAGQMLKPPHPVARLAYALALGINPNNHA